MNASERPESRPDGELPAGVPGPSRSIGSEELLHGRRELLIVHAGETYRLRVTRNGKLILQK